jgi:hypothetical protein
VRFLNALCKPCAVNDRWYNISLLLGGVRQHVETLHGIVPGLFIVRVAPFVDRSAVFIGSFVVTATSLRQSKTSSHTYCLFSLKAR